MSELKVTITDERGNSETESVSVPQDTNDPTKANNNAVPKTATGAKNYKSTKGLAIASMIGSRAFSYTTSNVGKWTGNSQNQNTVNNFLQVGSLTAMAYVNPYVALATVAINVATTAIDTGYEYKWNNKTAERKQHRAGETIGRRH